MQRPQPLPRGPSSRWVVGEGPKGTLKSHLFSGLGAQFAISFNLVPLDALRLIVCDDFPPCTGDLTPFVNFPPPAFVPDFYYANYLSMAPTKGICWAANQVQTKAVFQEQPALTLSSYNGHVNAWGVKVAVSMLQAQTARNMSCPVVNAGVPNPREFERQGW